MSKKHTHGTIPRGNQPKHAIDPQRKIEVEVEEEEQEREDTQVDNLPIGTDDIADERGRITPPVVPQKQD